MKKQDETVWLIIMALIVLISSLCAGDTNAQGMGIRNPQATDIITPQNGPYPPGAHLLMAQIDYWHTDPMGAILSYEWKLTTEPASAYRYVGADWVDPTGQFQWNNNYIIGGVSFPVAALPAKGVKIHVRIQIFGFTIGGPGSKVITHTVLN